MKINIIYFVFAFIVLGLVATIANQGERIELLQSQLNESIDGWQESNDIANDLVTVTNKYDTLYWLCEEKYQTGIDGDWDGAYTVKGRADKLYEEILDILDKYQNRSGELQLL